MFAQNGLAEFVSSTRGLFLWLHRMVLHALLGKHTTHLDKARSATAVQGSKLLCVRYLVLRLSLRGCISYPRTMPRIFECMPGSKPVHPSQRTYYILGLVFA